MFFVYLIVCYQYRTLHFLWDIGGVPTGAFVLVEGDKLDHVILIEREVKDVDVLLDSVSMS